MNLGGSSAGRGRGRGKIQSIPQGAWNPHRINHNANRRVDKKVNAPKEFSAKENGHRAQATHNGTINDDEWKNRVIARDSRLQKAKRIKEDAAANFSHLLVESDSSDEELREEEILRKTMDSYAQQLAGKSLLEFLDDALLLVNNSFLSNLIEANNGVNFT